MQEDMDQMMKQASSGADVVKGARRLVESPSTGLKYLIRRLDPFMLMAAMGSIPDLEVFSKEAQELKDKDLGEAVELAQGKGKQTVERMQQVVTAGLIAPKIGDAGFQITDLTLQDLLLLFNHVLDLAGFNERAADEVRPSQASVNS